MRNRIVYILIALLFVNAALAQNNALSHARSFVEKKDYQKALDLYNRLYKQTPTDIDVYNDYFELLIVTKDYKQAEKLAEEQKAIRHNYPLPFVDLGRVYLLQGKEKKATEQFEQSLAFINGDDILTRQMANKLIEMGRDDYAIRAYERGRELLRVPFMYTGPLSRMYAKKGLIEKAIDVMLEGYTGFYMNNPAMNVEDTKASLLEILGTDPKKLQLAQKALVKKINERPENDYYAELLTWLYTQKDDWEGAMMQIVALDERNKEEGKRIIVFAQYAVKNEHYETGIKAYDEVITNEKDSAYQVIAKTEKIAVLFLQLQNNPAYTKENVTALSKQYEQLFTELPQCYAFSTVKDYAKLEARYNDNPQKGITLLEKALEQTSVTKQFIGECKLQLGDYKILVGKVWEASLLYSQVDKAFREDMLGEEARFRNAKLSYYNGDFDWAQSQLTVLKASTSELIANDALYLSILITENVTGDSNLAPINRFAYADLLLFQNKDKEAETLLDSIAANFPEHPLIDDILMQKARLSIKHRAYDKAITYLASIHDKYGTDVLGDDAVFTTAELYRKYLNKPDEAKKYYEKLVLEYPGSTYIQTARNMLISMQTVQPSIQ
jgi:predicted Zn-dependent protease